MRVECCPANLFSIHESLCFPRLRSAGPFPSSSVEPGRDLSDLIPPLEENPGSGASEAVPTPENTRGLPGRGGSMSKPFAPQERVVTDPLRNDLFRKSVAAVGVGWHSFRVSSARFDNAAISVGLALKFTFRPWTPNDRSRSWSGEGPIRLHITASSLRSQRLDKIECLCCEFVRVASVRAFVVDSADGGPMTRVMKIDDSISHVPVDVVGPARVRDEWRRIEDSNGMQPISKEQHFVAS
jgi:hypothetical protein